MTAGPLPAVGRLSVERAIGAAGLDPRQFEPGRDGDPDHERARALCRLSEALFYRGWLEAAVDCARRACDMQPWRDDILDFCAWLYSNCRRHDLAAATYEQMLEQRPDWAAGHRHASGSYQVTGDLDWAVFHARMASDCDRTCFEFALHAGCLLAEAGEPRIAAHYLQRAAGISPEHPGLLHRLSANALECGDPERALSLALHALRLDADDPAAAMHAAELLLRAGRLDEAAAIIAEAAGRHPSEAALWRQLSAAEMLRDRIAEALAAIERAIAIAPDRPEYHVHRGDLLYRQGCLDAAAEAFGRAAELDPSNRDARRSQLTAYCDAGRLGEALAIGGELVRAAPDNAEYARALLTVLNRRLDFLEGAVVDPGAAPRRRSPPASRRFLDALATQRRVIHALIIRETRTRFGEASLGYGWALLEPILHILMLSLVFAVLMRGRPPIGGHFFIFYYTGIIPYHLFVHASSNMTYAISSNGSLLQLPPVTTFDVIVARGVLELVTDVLVAVILLAGFAAIGLGAVPHDLWGASLALLAVWLLGCGCGFVNAVLNIFWKSWDKLWVQLTRLLYFCSGIFYVPGMMPDWARDLLAWNPVLQGVDWFRAAFFAEYAPHWLDRRYLVMVGLLAVLVGAGLERGLRRRLYEPQ